VYVELIFHVVNSLDIRYDVAHVEDGGVRQVETSNQHDAFMNVTFHVCVLSDSNVGSCLTFTGNKPIEQCNKSTVRVVIEGPTDKVLVTK
jgi:hypothetical protein